MNIFNEKQSILIGQGDNIFGGFINSYIYHQLRDAIEGISQAGFKYLEILSTPGLAKGLLQSPIDIKYDDVEKLKSLITQNKVSIISWYYYKGGKEYFVNDKILSQFKRMLKIASILKIKYLTTDTDEVTDSFSEKEFYKYIDDIGDIANNFGIKICIDIHGKWICNGEKASKIIKKIKNPNIGINYCTGNTIYYSNSRPEEDIKYAIPYLFKVHLKDSSGIFQDYSFPALGEGKVDFYKIFSELKDFTGPYIVEIELSNKVVTLSQINSAFKKSSDFLSKIYNT